MKWQLMEMKKYPEILYILAIVDQTRFLGVSRKMGNRWISEHAFIKCVWKHRGHSLYMLLSKASCWIFFGKHSTGWNSRTDGVYISTNVT